MIEPVDSIPMMLEKSGRKVLIYGGGVVAGRKAEYFAGMDMTVVAPEIADELRKSASSCVDDKAEDNLHFIENFDIIIAATDDKALNTRIVEEARSSRKMVNSAHGGGNFMIPAVRRREGYVLCASTESRAPVWAPYILDRIMLDIDESDDRMFRLLVRLRQACRNVLPDARARRIFLQSAMEDPALWDLLKDGREEEAFTLASSRLEGSH